MKNIITLKNIYFKKPIHKKIGDKLNFIKIEKKDNIAILKLDRGVTSPINLDLVSELRTILKKEKENTDTKSVILTSNNEKFFSIGFSLPELIKLDKNQLREFYQNYNKLSIELYTFPKPTIAVMMGHAIAGGCILALCCDYRIIADGRKLMGLNEVKLGLPVPYPGDCILRSLVNSRIARNVMEIGEFYPSDELLKMGMVDEVYSIEEIFSKAVEKAKKLGDLPEYAIRKIKNNRTENVKEQILKNLVEKEELFFKCWFKDETQKLLKEAVIKF